MHSALELHNGCLRKCIRECNGYEVKTVGDSFVIAFQSVEDAAAFMISAQHALLHQPWSETLLSYPDCEPVIETSAKYIEEPTPQGQVEPCPSIISASEAAISANIRYLWCGLRVRMGCHVGEVDREYVDITGRVDYFGPPVNMAARVESMAHGGEILISETCAELLHELYPKTIKSVGICCG